MTAQIEYQYVLVQAEQDRNVYVDGELAGRTGELMQMEPGMYTFDLGEPKDYEPKKKRISVKATSEKEPLIIEFRFKPDIPRNENVADIDMKSDFAAQNKMFSEDELNLNEEVLNTKQQAVKSRKSSSTQVETNRPRSDTKKSSGVKFLEKIQQQAEPLNAAQLIEASLAALGMAHEQRLPMDGYMWFLCLLITPYVGGEQQEETWSLVLQSLRKELGKEELTGFEQAKDTANEALRYEPLREFISTLTIPHEIYNDLDIEVREEVFNVISRADDLSKRLFDKNNGMSVRHVLAVLLFDPKSGTRVRSTLRSQGVNVDRIRPRFMEVVTTSWPEEDVDTWAKLVSPESLRPLKDETTPDPFEVSGEETPKEGEALQAGRYQGIFEIDTGDGEVTSPVFAGYAADSAEEKQDLLGITRDVKAICSILAARDVPLPLSLGLFGDWGTGKTFFMNRMHERIELLANESKGLTKDQTAYSPNIVQIRFNAWHYIDANLWACLVTHILDSLYNYLAGEPDNPWESAVENLEQAEGLHEAARHSLTQAEKSVEKAEQALQTVKQKRERKEQDIETRFNSLTNLLTDNTTEQFKKVVKDFGLEEAIQSLDDLNSQLQELRSRSGRFKGFFVVMLQSKYAIPYFGLLLLLLFIPVGIGVLVPQLTGQGGFAVEFGTLIGQLGAGVVGFIAWLKRPLGWVTTGLTQLEKVQQEAENAQKAKIEAAKGEPAEMELAALQERERAARETLRESEKRLQVAQVELEEAQPSRRLYRLIEERTESEDYRSRLGIISLIRNDFEKLSELIRPDKDDITKLVKEGKPIPDPIPVDRIILYIDDLDRCPQHRVVEVLEAVHLLLAFPIFAVVVGVDPRWLRRSLELHYPHLLTSLSEDGTTIHSENGSIIRKSSRTRAATPQNYLEKIFQIPFNLRPMGKGGYQALVKKLSEVQQHENIDELSIDRIKAELELNAKANEVTPVTENEPMQEAALLSDQDYEAIIEEQIEDKPESSSGDALLPRQSEDVTAAEEEAMQKEIAIEPDKDEFYDESNEEGTGEANHQNDEEELVLVPPMLELIEHEKKYIATLHRLFSTPRAVKRFVNTYRIFRARLPDSMIKKHINEDNEVGEYRCALVLLGIITGFPSLTPKAMRLLFLQPADATWKQFVSELAQSRLSENDFPTDELPQSILEMEADWLRMCDALGDLGLNGSLPFDMKTFAKWTPRVARFSFSNILPPWRALDSGATTQMPDLKKMSEQASGEDGKVQLDKN